MGQEGLCTDWTGGGKDTELIGHGKVVLDISSRDCVLTGDGQQIWCAG